MLTMAFLKNYKPIIEEEQNLLKALNNQQSLSDDVKKRLQKLNNQLNTILKQQKMLHDGTQIWNNKILSIMY